MRLLHRSAESEPPDILRAALETAFEHPGCPFCYLIRKAEHRAFWMTLWENVTDPDVRIGFQVRRGFCAHHTRRFSQVDRDEHLGGSGVAAFLEGLCITVAEDLERRPPAMRTPRCEPCETDARKTLTWTNVILREGKRASFRAAYERSQGLCLEHLRFVLDHARDAAIALWIVQTTRAQFADLHLSDPSVTASNGGARRTVPPGCPVCSARREAEQQALRALRSEGHANGHPAKADVLACEPHTRRLLRPGAREVGRDDLARAWWGRLAEVESTYQAHAARAAASRLPRALAWRVPDSSWPTARCQPCEQTREAATPAVASSARALETVPLHEVMADGRALCRAHLADVLSAASAPAQTRLASHTAQQLRALADSLREFQRKCGWQARGEPKGDEQHSLARALAFFAG